MRSIIACLAGLAGLTATTASASTASPLAIGLSIILAVGCAALGWILAGWLEIQAARRGLLHVATWTSRAEFTHLVSIEDDEGRPAERGFIATCGEDPRAWSVADQRWAARPDGAARAAIYTARNSWRGPHKDALVGWVDQDGHHDATATAPKAKETFPCSDR